VIGNLGMLWKTVHLVLIVDGCLIGGFCLCLGLVLLGYSLGMKDERDKFAPEERILVETYRVAQRFDQIDAVAEAGMRDIASWYRR
jgi:hypothetical protein